MGVKIYLGRVIKSVYLDDDFDEDWCELMIERRKMS